MDVFSVYTHTPKGWNSSDGFCLDKASATWRDGLDKDWTGVEDVSSRYEALFPPSTFNVQLAHEYPESRDIY